MLFDGLLDILNFTLEEKEEYFKYEKMAGTQTEALAKEFMLNNIPFSEISERLDSLKNDEIHRFTIDLLFILNCTSYLYDKYKAHNIEDEFYIDAMWDIRAKFNECVQVKKVFGIYPVQWYPEFFSLERIALGRLQFDIKKHENEAITVSSHTINKGDFVLYCHIPSGKPLTPKLCVQSLKKAYKFFSADIKDGILPVFCFSWLLYPEYKSVFSKNSNTFDFIRNFKLISVLEEDEFHDAWRVFGMDYTGNPDELPSETTMQRSFIEYIKSSGKFGECTGLLLFDGENILTRDCP